mmetsp:Transcript_226/g.397  ORF Transcript_226/g.397 Transcript_226/m.397 type:complete len:221 (-) Transcript_226:69-731(-)
MDLDVLKARLGEPLDVLAFLWEQHPDVGKEAGDGPGGVDGADEAGGATWLDHSVGLRNPTLWLRPILDASCGHISVELVRLKRKVLRVALDDGDVPQWRLRLCLFELMRALVQQRHVRRGHVFHHAKRSEPSSATNVDNLQVRIIKFSDTQRVLAHILRPVTWVHDVVVDDGEVAVEPEGLVFVLDQSRRRAEVAAVGGAGVGRCATRPRNPLARKLRTA